MLLREDICRVWWLRVYSVFLWVRDFSWVQMHLGNCSKCSWVCRKPSLEDWNWYQTLNQSINTISNNKHLSQQNEWLSEIAFHLLLTQTAKVSMFSVWKSRWMTNLDCKEDKREQLLIIGKVSICYTFGKMYWGKNQRLVLSNRSFPWQRWINWNPYHDQFDLWRKQSDFALHDFPLKWYEGWVSLTAVLSSHKSVKEQLCWKLIKRWEGKEAARRQEAWEPDIRSSLLSPLVIAPVIETEAKYPDEYPDVNDLKKRSLELLWSKSFATLSCCQKVK